MRLICGIWILSKYSFRVSKNTQRSIPRDTSHAVLIWTHTENVSILVKYFLVYVEIRDFVLTFQFFIAHWNVFPVSGKWPQTLIFYLNSLTDRGAKWFVFFKISPFSLPLLSVDHKLLDTTNLTGFLKYMAWHDKGLGLRQFGLHRAGF